MDDSAFYLTALIIPLGFVLVGSLTRFIINRKLEWEICYLGVDLILVGLAAAVVHLISPHIEPTTLATQTGSTSSLLTSARTTDIIGGRLLPPSAWSYGQKAGAAIALLFATLIILAVIHILFDMQSKPLSKTKKIWEVLLLGLFADVAATGAVVYMERILR